MVMHNATARVYKARVRQKRTTIDTIFSMIGQSLKITDKTTLNINIDLIT
jgi:hypothetical protein